MMNHLRKIIFSMDFLQLVLILLIKIQIKNIISMIKTVNKQKATLSLNNLQFIKNQVL